MTKQNSKNIFKIILCCGALVATISCSWPTSQSISVRLHSPTFTASPEMALPLGSHARFTIGATDAQNGVCALTATLTQNAVTANVPLTASPNPEKSPKERDYVADIPDLAVLNFTEGEAIIAVAAENCSIFKGDTLFVQKSVIDFTPPRVALTSTQHYINLAGADVATYNVSPDAVWSGVEVGPYKFKGYARPGAPDPNEHFAFFVFSYELPQDTAIAITAIDAAGNISKTTLAPSKFFPKEFRKRDITIDDDFITTKVADIITNTPGLKNSSDNLNNFLAVNRDLRKINNRVLIDLAGQSEEKFYWKNAFLPLANASIEASFADYRTYFYQQQKVDEQVHLGFDMAVIERTPVSAAAAGKVLFAGYLGIYGNTLVLDHGYGITTLYAHLSSFDVKKDDIVNESQKIGVSGATGLAGGDHLHFSLLIQGVQTNPVEFWDQHWIQDHVYLRLGEQMFGRLE